MGGGEQEGAGASGSHMHRCFSQPPLGEPAGSRRLELPVSAAGVMDGPLRREQGATRGLTSPREWGGRSPEWLDGERKAGPGQGGPEGQHYRGGVWFRSRLQYRLFLGCR